MKIAVLGAGAVGCYYGGMLARAGHAVTLIGRPEHVAALLRDGLLLETNTLREHVPVGASVHPAAIEGADLVLFCVKSTDTEDAGRQMLPYVTPATVVLSLQNGVDNAQRLQARLPCAVAAAVVYVGTGMAGPGHVQHHGRGDLVIGPQPAGARIVQLFGEAGIDVVISHNLMGALWAKLIINCAYNALSAIVQLPYGRLVQGAGIEDTMRAVMDECLAVAAADGVTVPGITWEVVRGIADAMPAQISSTARDLARGKRGEVDHLNGYVVRRGSARAVATPVNGALQAIVKVLEDKSGAA